jgi:hypothetical protein
MAVHEFNIDNWDCCCVGSQLLHKQWQKQQLGMQG